MVGGLKLGVFGAALATLIAQGISAVLSLLIFFVVCENMQVCFIGLTKKNCVQCLKSPFRLSFNNQQYQSV